MSRIRDLEQEIPSLGDRSEVCIVGAGAAGIVLAVELLRLGRRVTLLEAGGADIEAASQEPYQSELVGLPHLGVHGGRFRVKGGSTTRWGGQILELDDADFESRPHVSGSGWPLQKASLTRFYERALELEGLSGVLRKNEAVWASLGQPEPAFASLEEHLSRWCPEPDFARLHYETLETHPRLDVWLHANAIELKMEGERACGVRCRSLAGREATFLADEYVFCLGGLESIRFFLQPREGTLPWNRSGLLGRHFQDHIDGRGAVVVPLRRKNFHNVFDNIFLNGLKYQLKLRLSQDEQNKLETLNVAGNMIFVTSDQAEQDQVKATARHLLNGRWGLVKVADLAKMAKNTSVVLRQTYRYKVQQRLFNPVDATIVLRVWCEQEPLSKSSVSLSDTRDSLGMLRTRLNWCISDCELETMRRYVEVASRSLQGLATLQANDALLAGDGSFRELCQDCNHHMGGMRMSSSPWDGVVDTNLRLHGTINAFVCSAAVFPSSGYSNPTHTVLALAVRLAEHLASHHL